MAKPNDGQGEGDTGIVTKTKHKTREKLQKPPMYKVLLHNDDYTTREFVVEILCNIFHHTESEAVHIMLHVHHRGVGVAGVFTYEIADTKIKKVEALAREREFPLRLSMEPED